MGRLARRLGIETTPLLALDGFVDSLLQTFENSRPGLTSDMLQIAGTEAFFRELYERELSRLREKVARLGHLSQEEREDLFHRVDERIRKVVLPAYARLATRFTQRERNDFFLTPEGLHGAERVAWGVLGGLLGAFVVWAPFIPLWSKEWVLVFGVGGLVFPNLRAYLAQRRYQSDLNDLVVRTDEEIWRLDLGYMTPAVGGEVAARAERGSEADPGRLAAHPEDAARLTPGSREPRAAGKER